MSFRFRDSTIPVESGAVLLAILLAIGCSDWFTRTVECPDVERSDWSKTDGSWQLDGRHEYHESTDDTLRDAARSTAVLLNSSALSHDDSASKWRLSKGAELRTCCAEEQPCRPYGGQRAVGRCTGFLIEEDELVTARHCLEQVPCDSLKIIFGHYHSSQNSKPFPVEEKNVYSCQQVLEKGTTDVTDAAVLKLDRTVDDRPPLEPSLSLGDRVEGSVGLVGAPGGIPLKLSAPGSVTADKYEKAMIIDGFVTGTGDSGGPIIDLQSGRVVGLLMGSQKDSGRPTALHIECLKFLASS